MGAKSVNDKRNEQSNDDTNEKKNQVKRVLHIELCNSVPLTYLVHDSRYTIGPGAL